MTGGLKSVLWGVATRLRLLRHRQWPAWQRYRQAQSPQAGNLPSTCTARRLLLLTWEFPPQVTGGVYRPLSFVRHAAASGWQAEVVCGPAPSGPTEAGRYLAGLMPDSVPVSRVASDTGPHPWPLPGIDGGIVNALSLYEAAAARIAPGETGVILASGPPFANFVAGYWLARRTGWPLVLDYRDEWTETPFRFVQKDGPNRQWETRCLERADLVIHTTPSQVAHARERFPVLAGKRQAVVYNGWEPGDFATTAQPSPKDADAPITLAYLGNLGAMAAPDAFLDTLAGTLAAKPDLRARLRLRLVGHKRPEALEKLKTFPYPEVLDLVDSIPKTEACRMMQEVDGLLLLNPPGIHRYIQGKLYEYIASGTPILVFGSGGEMGDIVDSLGAGVTVAEGDARGMADALSALRTSRDGDPARRRDWLASRERAVQAQALYRELEALVRAPGSTN
ncbi:MAG: glycosyltransferase [Pseudomonadales bacterium]|nr:glycosyltransferase [Pseudomonadales bacterium]